MKHDEVKEEQDRVMVNDVEGYEDQLMRESVAELMAYWNIELASC